MDPLLRDALARLCTTHRLGPAVRRDLDRFVDMLVDPRLQLTGAPPLEADGAGAETDFEDLGLIGRGGMGEVRRVHERALGRVIAMKVLRDETHLAWFEREARLTASLDHPGVLPLYRFSILPDGRRYFTMREARGRTLREALDEPEGRSQRRLFDGLRRAAETVSYAHSRGIVHRDLKPENLLLGEFGEVWVLDWGIAGLAGDVAGVGVGTPRYMSPEQAAGGELGPQSDVWALGALLYEIATGHPASPTELGSGAAVGDRGRPPRLGLPLAPELARIVARATSAAPAERHPHAGAFAEALAGWLEGTRAREEALATLTDARTLFARVAERRARAVTLRVRAAAALRQVPGWAPTSLKEDAWAQEEEAAGEDAEAVLEEANAVELARAALQRAPDLEEAHVLLADHFRLRLDEAEAVGDPSAPRLEAQLRAHDTGAHTAWLAGDGWLTLLTEPTGARVTARPFVSRGRRLVEGAPVELGRTPLVRVPLPRGSWLLTVAAPGRPDVRYPVRIRRGEHWDGRPPGGAAPVPVYLPAAGELGRDERYVPAGWFNAGGDDVARFGLPAARIWLDAFAVQRFAVTCGDWLQYVQRLYESGNVDRAMAAVPRERHGQISDGGAPMFGLEGGRFVFRADSDGDMPHPDWPVMLIDHAQALAYAAWRRDVTGLPWRLLSGLEHEKASRGVDARLYPWGNGHDPTFACCADAFQGPPHPMPVDSFPVDESVYGVRGLVGGMLSLCSDVLEDGRVEARGCYWNAAGQTARAAARIFFPSGQRGVSIGVRLARSLS